MGCGGSKLESDDEENATPGLRPFRRRIDEIRQRRTARTVSKDDTFSTKQLLNDEGEDGLTETAYIESQKSMPSQEPIDQKEKVAGLDKGQTATSKNKHNINEHHHPMDAPESEMRMSVCSSPEDEISRNEQHNQTKDHNNNNNMNNVEPDKPKPVEPVKPVKLSPGKDKNKQREAHGERKKEDDSSTSSDDENEIDGNGEAAEGGYPYEKGREIGPGSPTLSREGGNIYEDGRQIAPGSPSFREYFLSSSSRSAGEDSFDASNRQDRSTKVKKNSKVSRTKENSSCSSNEGSMEKLVKKENKGRRFKNVLPKGKPGGVKNLWNVGSCYHPSNSSNHGKVDA